MHKLKPDRKKACSPKSIDRIFTIVAENWDEVWEIVQIRAQATKAINRQHLRNLRTKSFTL
jgi:DNA-binding transcriptional regulator PaaX